MSKKTRYLLIVLGVIVFLILAPLIVLYVRGIAFDFAAKKFVHTGILAVRTDPKSAEIFLDGKKARNSQGDIKFLVPGEYDVTVKKTGYFDWSKRLSVRTGQVTWASPAPNKLSLFLKDRPATTLSEGVRDFYAGGNSLAYISGNSLAISVPGNQAQSENYSLPKTVNKILASPDGRTMVLVDVTATTSAPVILAFDWSSHYFTDLTGMFVSPVELKFSGNNQLYGLSDRILYRIDIGRQSKTVIKPSVTAFAFRENDLYYLQATQTAASLLVSSPAENSGTMILDKIPHFKSGQVFVNYEKQVLLLLDNSLYQVGSMLEPLANNIGGWDFDYAQSSVVFFHEGELGYYNPFRHGVDFITRSSSAIIEPTVNFMLDYSFFIRDNKLETLELDNRGRQNNYVLYAGANLQKYVLTDNAASAYVLDNGQLKYFKIR